jgi:hypothetical protein
MPPNWVTHLLWLTNQKHNHLIFFKKLQALLEIIYCVGQIYKPKPNFTLRQRFKACMLLQARPGQAIQAILRLPVEMLELRI